MNISSILAFIIQQSLIDSSQTEILDAVLHICQKEFSLSLSRKKAHALFETIQSSSKKKLNDKSKSLSQRHKLRF
ncbi:MAG: hypothetical protein ACMXYA_03050, partial [Candidatus Woesearchaeota archaeon]